jgi:signal transduction histidine kinase
MAALRLESLRSHVVARIDHGLRAFAARIPGPRPTIRLRLTVTYGLVFLITGGVLLTIGYLLVRSNIGGHHIFRALGIRPPVRAFPDSNVIHSVQQQIQSDALHRLLVEYLFALGVMTMIAVGTGWLLAGRALRPLREITSTARLVSSENLGERIGLIGPADELKELADTFDSMLARLDGAFASHRHFVANASHELRTPLAIMRTEVDVALADPAASRQELRTMGEAMREMIDRCEQLIESLLMLARSEAATGRVEAVDLAALAADCITDLRARADDAEVSVAVELDPAWTHGEPALLERMIGNLIDNGIQHNEVGGLLRVSTSAHDDRVRLSVLNGGPRIDPLAVQTLTEPFRRLDRDHMGFGLGLSIVRSVVEAHGGRLELGTPDSGGLEVRVSLPGAPTPPPPNVAGSRTRGALTQS